MGKSDQPSYVGTCVWFNDSYGYGFLECAEFPKNVFVHYSRIVSHEDFKTLAKGQIVRFEVVETTKGFMAVNVREAKIIKVNASVVDACPS